MYNVVTAKSNFYTAKITKYLFFHFEKLNRNKKWANLHTLGIFRVEEFIWRVDPQLWWRDECAQIVQEKFKYQRRDTRQRLR